MKKKRTLLLVAAVVLCAAGIKIYDWYDAMASMSGSAMSDLHEQMSELGVEECTAKELISRDTDLGRLKIVEDVSYSFDEDGISRWNDSMIKEDKNGVPLNTDRWITKYSCNVQSIRYAMLNEKAVANTDMHRIVTYKAYEDNDLRSGARASLDKNSAQTAYTSSEDEFEDLEKQLDDALKMIEINE